MRLLKPLALRISAMNMNSGTAVSANAVHAAPAHQAEAVERRQAALQQQIDDRRHGDRERHRHPGREQAEKQRP